jgi:CubicO group peptidase (beta-lactamase class C family)
MVRPQVDAPPGSHCEHAAMSPRQRRHHLSITTSRSPRAARSAAGRAAVGALAVAVLLAACSDDDPVTTPATTSAAATTDAPDVTDSTDTTEATDTTDAPATTDTPDTTDADEMDEVDDSEAIDATRALFDPLAPDDPGCTIAVGRSGEVVYAEAFGAARLDPLEPMTTETIVDIGSTSKQFTANAILLLAERGEVDLEEPLSSYVSDLPVWADDTTLRQLVHHTSGIPDYIELLVGEGFDLTGSSTDADALAALADVEELDFEPDTAWEYSNSNYFLLGQVVLAVTGSTLAEFLDAEVFGPLGLEMIMNPVAEIPGKATSYEGLGDAAVVADSGWEQLGDGGIQTTPSELVRWAAQYWAPTIGDDEINAARLDDAADIVDPTDPGEAFGRYGAGIQITDEPDVGTVLSHSGGWGGFVTAFVVVPDQQLAMAATCTSPDSAMALGVESDLDFIEAWLA